MVLNKLIGKIAEQGTTRVNLAEVLAITPYTVSQKLKGKWEFTASEIKKTCDYLKISYADIPIYFFEGVK